jgi:hypothetical protein
MNKHISIFYISREIVRKSELFFIKRGRNERYSVERSKKDKYRRSGAN